MVEKTRKQVSKKFVKDYYSSYFKLIMEVFDKPLSNITKLSDNTFKISEDNTEAIISFDEVQLDEYDIKQLDISQVKNVYDISWYFTSKSDNSSSSWKRVISTLPKVINNFMSNHNVDVLTFSPLDKTDVNRIYSHPIFKSYINKIFGDKYIFDRKWLTNMCFLYKKEFDRSLLKEVEKISSKTNKSKKEIYNMLTENISSKKNLKGSSLTSYIKEQIERIVLKKIYIKHKYEQSI